MKILITGGSGVLGFRLNNLLSKNHEICTLYNKNTGNCKNYNSHKIDLTNFDSLEEIFKNFQPDVVIHTAAVSNQNKTKEISNKEVYDINVNVTEKIAQLCLKYNSKLIYTSTDLVYAGYRGTLLKEDSKLVPLSLYAETKLMGEVKIKNTLDNYIILRTALLYDLRKDTIPNYFNWMYYEFKKGNKVNLFHDQYRSPLAAMEAAEIISKIISQDIKSETLNFGGPSKLNRVELAFMLCDIAGFDQNLINPISMNSIPDFVKVEDVSMDLSRLNILGIFPKPNYEIIEDLLEELND